jgi:signal transduction histidine kinase
VLRPADEEDAGDELAPMPTLAQLPRLVAAIDRAGPRVTLDVRGSSRPLPSGVELTIFRIVQEALTNARKHAGPDSTAAVTLDFRPGAVSVEVVDDGHGSPTGRGAGPGTGHGLVGIRERVSSHHGTLSVGALDAGRGFRLCADIPIEGPS